MTIHAGTAEHAALVKAAVTLAHLAIAHDGLLPIAYRLNAFMRDLDDPTCPDCGLPRSLHDDGECPST